MMHKILFERPDIGAIDFYSVTRFGRLESQGTQVTQRTEKEFHAGGSIEL